MQATLGSEMQHLSGQIGRAEDVGFAPIGPIDHKSLTGHFDRLSAEDLRFRFGSRVSSTWVAEYVAGFAEAPGEVLAAWSNGEIYALGEFRIARRHPAHQCELALSVLKAYRNEGHGTALLNALLEIAKTAGFERAHLQVLHENRPMRRICRNKQADSMRFGPELIYVIRTAPNQMQVAAV